MTYWIYVAINVAVLAVAAIINRKVLVASLKNPVLRNSTIGGQTIALGLCFIGAVYTYIIGAALAISAIAYGIVRFGYPEFYEQMKQANAVTNELAAAFAAGDVDVLEPITLEQFGDAKEVSLAGWSDVEAGKDR